MLALKTLFGFSISAIDKDKDVTKERNLNTFRCIASGERAATGSRTEKKEILCMDVIAGNFSFFFLPLIFNSQHLKHSSRLGLTFTTFSSI